MNSLNVSNLINELETGSRKGKWGYKIFTSLNIKGDSLQSSVTNFSRSRFLGAMCSLYCWNGRVHPLKKKSR